jgi:hypothetical protein
MNSAKIQLSTDELLLLQNSEWILTKNTIIQKVYGLFGSLAEEMRAKITDGQLPEAITVLSPKISKGENYEGLPYVMLDYPRFFTRENVFAIRTFFWWANYFSVSLHLKGDYKMIFIESLQKNISLLRENDFYICVSEDEWQHNITREDYVLLSELKNETVQEHLMRKSFLKLSARINLVHWNESEKKILHLYTLIIGALRAQLPRR